MWLAEEGNRCHDCGTYWWQWKWYDEQAGKWKRIRHPELHAEPETCLGCREREQLQRAYSRADTQPPPGLKILWYPSEQVEGADAAIPHDGVQPVAPAAATQFAPSLADRTREG